MQTLRLFLLGGLCSFYLSSYAEETKFHIRDFQIPQSEETSTLQEKARRRMLVFEGIAQDLPWSGKAINDAAIIFQHTNTENEPDDGESYRSQEIHLLTFFLLIEQRRLINEPMTALLGPYRYCRAMGLPKELDVDWVEDPMTKHQVIAPNTISDYERMKRGFPFPLLAVYQRKNENQLLLENRTTKRDTEIAQLYLADQQTRSLFKKDEMIFNRYIERVGDAQRRARLYEMIAEDVLWDAKTLHEAALLLDNTASIVRKKAKLIYQLQENHLLAFFLARQAYLKGKIDAASTIVTSFNNYVKASQMPTSFQIELISSNPVTICKTLPPVSVEQWGKYEFPFAIGRVIKPLCERNTNLEELPSSTKQTLGSKP